MFSSFGSKFSFGRAKIPVVVAPVVPATGMTYGGGGADPTALATAGYTYQQNADIDDGFFTFTIPFTFYWYGTGYTTLAVGSNTYITFGAGSSAYFGLILGPTPNPALPAIHLGSRDNSYQRGWTKTWSDRATIRYEGNGITSGTAGSPGLVYEATFFKAVGSAQYIQFNIGNHNATGGTFGVTNGLSGGSSLYTTFTGLAPNISFYISTDATGNNPTYHSGLAP
jgi:hypothetical protein